MQARHWSLLPKDKLKNEQNMKHLSPEWHNNTKYTIKEKAKVKDFHSVQNESLEIWGSLLLGDRNKRDWTAHLSQNMSLRSDSYTDHALLICESKEFSQNQVLSCLTECSKDQTGHYSRKWSLGQL